MAHLDNHSSTIKGKENVISGSSSEGPVNVCIFRVPYPIRSFKEEAYAPSVVSLGPYGYGSNCTMEKHKHVAVEQKNCTMEKHKHEAVERTAERINRKQNILVNEINKLHGKVKQYYEEAIEWDAEMMTCDACFIIEFFKCAANKRGDSDKGSSIFVFQNKGYKNSLYSAISVDIMKLENQVPLFILVEILKLEFQDEAQDKAITEDKAITKLADILSQSRTFRGFPFYPLDKDVDAKKNLEKHIRKGACHLLDLYRMVIEGRLTTSSQESNNASPHGNAQIPDSSEDTSSTSQAVSAEKSRNAGSEFKSKSHTPSAEKLKNAGIKFEPGKIGFKKNSFLISTLYLPAITLKYRTETLLRNLMAYEECQRCSFGPKKTVTSKYVHLLDSLIDSEKDVSVLRDSKVILSFVGSDEVVARMFNNLEIGITVENPDDPVANPSDSESIDENDGHVAVTINPSEKIKDPETIDENDGHLAVTINHSEQIDEYGNAMTELRNHYNQKWNLWIGHLREEHFSNPWYVISLLAATALLIMTLIQTMYAVK